MSRKLFNTLMIMVMLGSLLISAAAASAAPAAPEGATKLPRIAIGAMQLAKAHLRPPRQEVVEYWLREQESIPLNATPDQVRAAVAAYYDKFAKMSESYVSPELQAMQMQREQDLASGKAGVAAVQPVEVNYLAMAVQFNVITETLKVRVPDATGTLCPEQDVVQPGTLQGQIPPPGPNDNASIWYAPNQTADPKFYENIIFGYKGMGRVRLDLKDPVDGLPGINLDGLTVQDYYDHMAGPGNVVLNGSVEGWVSVPHSQGYYGADPLDPETCQATSHYGGAGVPPAQLAVDTAAAYNATHPTYYNDTSATAFWPKYDANDDGFIDTFALIYAGEGQEGGGGSLGSFALWSHSWDVRAMAAYRATATRFTKAIRQPKTMTSTSARTRCSRRTLTSACW